MSIEEFQQFRRAMNDRILQADNLEIKRFFALFESFSVALVVGGSIVIPHRRRAVATLDELRRKS